MMWLFDFTKMEMRGMRYKVHKLSIEMVTKCIWSWLQHHRNEDSHMLCCSFEDKIQSTSHEKFCCHMLDKSEQMTILLFHVGPLLGMMAQVKSLCSLTEEW